MTKALAAEHADAARCSSAPSRASQTLNASAASCAVAGCHAGAGAARQCRRCSATARPRRAQAALDFDDLDRPSARACSRSSARVVGALQARRRARSHPGRRGPGHEPGAMAGDPPLEEEFFAGARRARPAAHAVRRRRREAVHLQLPGRRSRHVRRGRGQTLAQRAPARRAALAAHPAHALVPLGDAAAGGRRPHLRRSRAARRPDGGARGRQPRRHRTGHAGLVEVWPLEPFAGGQAVGALVAASRGRRLRRPRAPGSAYRRNYRRLDQELRDAAVAAGANPRRRHPDPGAQAARRSHRS